MNAKNDNFLENNDLENNIGDNNTSLVHTFRSQKLNHVWIFKSEENEKSNTRKEYPESSEDKCIRCFERFSGRPIYIPISFDWNKKCFVLDPFPCCSFVCAKGRIIEEKKCNMAEQLGWLSHIKRIYFGNNDPTCYIPLCVRKTHSNYGKIEKEDYEKVSKEKNMMIKNPPHMFVETWVEQKEIDIQSILKRKNKNCNANQNVSKKDQENYMENLERAVNESKKRKNPTQTRSVKMQKKM